MPFFFKNFWGNSQRTSLFSQKITISERCTEILRSLVFLPCLKGANSEEILDLFKQFFLNKPLKGYKY